MKEMFSDIAFSAISVLITLIAIYLSVRLLGKLAKFVICIVIIAFFDLALCIGQQHFKHGHEQILTVRLPFL